MSEQQEQDFTTNDTSPQPGAPKISESGVSYYRSLLNDAKWCADHPINADMVRRTLSEAIAATGQNLEPPVDDRTPQQKLHDHMHAVEPRQPADYRDIPEVFQEFAASLLLPQTLARVIVEDALAGGKKADAAKVLGARYVDDLKAAEALLQKAAHLPDGAKVKVTELGPAALAQLAVWGRHLAKAQATRPKS